MVVYDRAVNDGGIPERPSSMGVATTIAARLSSIPGVRGVAVFGSVARGTAQDSSDIDLLVLRDGTAPPRRELVARLPKSLRSRLGLRCYDERELSKAMSLETPFGIDLRQEARILVDPDKRLRELFSAKPTRPLLVHAEVELEVARLDVFANLDVFRDHYLYVLARIYAIGKSVAMLGTCAAGVPTFDRQGAFAVMEAHPPRPCFRVVSRGATGTLLPPADAPPLVSVAFRISRLPDRGRSGHERYPADRRGNRVTTPGGSTPVDPNVFDFLDTYFDEWDELDDDSDDPPPSHPRCPPSCTRSFSSSSRAAGRPRSPQSTRGPKSTQRGSA